MDDNVISIGDVVIHNTVKYIVVGQYNHLYYCLSRDGQYLGEYYKPTLDKTGEHYPIGDILAHLVN